MPQEVKNINLKNRYPGVKPFETDEANIFFGRDTDIKYLYELIFLKQVVVLYGKSGYGKSSLLKAGIIPKLQNEENWKHFTVRFQNFSERDNIETVSPTETIKNTLKEGLNQSSTQLLDQLLSDEGSFWYLLKAHQNANNRTQFILFFDQFEELFTYPKEQIDEFSEQLAQILYVSIPLQFRNRIRELSRNAELSDELNEFLYEKLDIKVVYSIRSDRMSLLNGLKEKHPYILQNCYELDALSPQQAEEAILTPAGLSDSNFKTSKIDFQREAIQAIVENISYKEDEKIKTSTATLQIICRYIEDKLVDKAQQIFITNDLLGDISNIFKNYYEEFLSEIESEKRHKVQHLIEDVFIENGKRLAFDEAYIKKEEFGINSDLLTKLEESSLLRKERSATGKLLYEVSHDSLVNAIEKVAKERREKEQEALKQEKEKQREIERLKLETQLEKERVTNEKLIDLNKKANFRLRIAIGLAVFSLIVAGIAFYFWKESAKAVELAKKSVQLANFKKNEAQSALFHIKILESRKFIEDADKYIYWDRPELAVKVLNKARKTLDVKYNLNYNDKLLMDSISKQIDNKLKDCKPK